MESTAIKKFNKLCLKTLVAVYFLILIGGIVRTTGSGMGCPDWPKCFGTWIPPTSINQLPSNYKENYASYRDKKNKKFASVLNTIGLKATATMLLNDASVLVESDFNATKTWIEYLNRLVGVIIGFLIILLFWRSLKFRKSHRAIFYFSLATLIGVLFQGWFGSIVVSTNLTTWTITIHMFLALLIVVFLVLLYSKSNQTPEKKIENNSKALIFLLWLCIASLLIQIFFGTQVRANIDRLMTSIIPRQDWIQNTGVDFLIHRSFSWLILLLHVILFLQTRKTIGRNSLSLPILVLILISVFTGVIMAYLSIPAYIQPIHLFVATVVFGLQLLLLLDLNTSSNKVLIK